MSLSKIEQEYNEQRTKRFGIDRFETEPIGKPQYFVEGKPPVPPSIHELNRLSFLREKFGISSLQLENGSRNGKQIQITLAQATLIDGRNRMSGLKTCQAKINYPGLTRLWYDVSK